MTSIFIKVYQRLILDHPVLSILAVVLFTILAGVFAKDFRLDASADSLVLENDADLRYYRSIRAQYGQDDFLVISYTPHGALFSPETLDDLRRLRDSLLEIERVESVVSILSVPLIDSPQVTFSELQKKTRTLDDPDTDLALARQEFLSSPLYRDLLVSQDGQTTAIQVILERDATFYELLNRRNALREKRQDGQLSKLESEELKVVSKAFKDYSAALSDQQSADIARVRTIMDRHREHADLFLGGVPMIASDMIDFIRHDLATFGIAVLIFLVGMLITIFHRPRWVILPMLCCFGTVLVMFGYLGLVEWRVTVVSSNFTSLLLIITLSMTVHLIERYNELYHLNPLADQQTLVVDMVRSKVYPSLYTSLTTIVAFTSLLVSGIRPVIDFGWMMAIGIVVAFMYSFILFPAGLMLLKPRSFTHRHDLTGAITRRFAHWIEDHSKETLAIYVVIAVVSVFGLTRLTVENRFIDNFKDSTEIYQGMEEIDLKLGGTIPLEVVLDADPEFLSRSDEPSAEDDFSDPFDDPFDTQDDTKSGLTGTSYWFNSYRLETVREIHDYLDQLPETGKVLSLATTMRLMKHLNNGQEPDNILLSVIHKKLPPDVDEALFAPYMTADGNQIRFNLRVYETDPSLRRNDFIKQVDRDLIETFDLKPEQVHLTGMLVLYNNVLQSLFQSQIQTIGAVFFAIMVMFLVLFRSLRLAILAIIPNLISAGIVLGLMGWLNIPLDIMTITIAAITIGIAVDDTIHYVHRYSVELNKDLDHVAAMHRTHASVGRAMFYTSIIIISGFSILTLSNFIPTIYFGLFTGLAMAVAMVANLTLLAILLMLVQPRKVCWLPNR
ncbi:MAG: MMPL family transporter [Deltaproteobacteria bacterium]|jgi:predicted RND superfamily exporter protein|nr:MMPL family transporter [Deltaproteobacteria bacterium]